MNFDNIVDIVIDFTLYIFIAAGLGTLMAGFFS